MTFDEYIAKRRKTDPKLDELISFNEEIEREAFKVGEASMLAKVKQRIKNMLLWSKGTVEGTRNDIIAKLSALDPKP